MKDMEKIFLSLFSGDDDIFINKLSKTTQFSRLHSYYHNFLSFIAEYKLNIITRTKTHPFSVKITPENAIIRQKFINTKNSMLNEEEIFIVGILVMGDIERNCFAIKD
jgi:hypothetical protein